MLKFKIGKTVEKKEKAVEIYSDVISLSIHPVPTTEDAKTRITLSAPALDALNLRKLSEEQVNNLSFANLEDGIANTVFFNFNAEGKAKEVIGITMGGAGSNKILITELRKSIETQYGVPSDEKIYVILSPAGEYSGYNLFKVDKVATADTLYYSSEVVNTLSEEQEVSDDGDNAMNGVTE